MTATTHPGQHGGFAGAGQWLRHAPSGMRSHLNLKWLLALAGLLVVAVVAVTMTGGNGNGGSSAITASQFDKVKLGMSQGAVRQLLGNPSRIGSKQFEVPTSSYSYGPYGTYPSTSTSTMTERNCWFYPVTGKNGGDVTVGHGWMSMSLGGSSATAAAVCFNSAGDASVYSGPMPAR